MMYCSTAVLKGFTPQIDHLQIDNLQKDHLDPSLRL